MKTTIICIGNRFVTADSAGLLVFDHLQTMQPLAEDISLIEGGLAGLNLLPFLEQGGRVIFIDAVTGFTEHGTIVLLDREEIINSETPTHFGHEAGLPYLLAVLPEVCDGEIPKEIILIGIEGTCTEEMVSTAATLSLTLAASGLQKCS